MSLRLVRLECPSCGSAMRGDSRDILFLCDHCGGGAVLGHDGLERIVSTALLPAAGRRAQLWRPAWVLETQVEVSQRVRAGGESTHGWSLQRTFVIPAFPLPLASLTLLARALSSAGGQLGEVPREPIWGGTLTMADALTLARYLVVAEEVAKPDMLASVEVAVTERQHRLAALPLEWVGDQLRCAVTGTRFKPEA